jgi:hypothetical protein
MNAASKRRQYADAPVPQFVAAAFDDNCPVIGEHPGRGLLVTEKREQIVGRIGVQIVLDDQTGEGRWFRQFAKFAHQRSDAPTKLQRPTRSVTLPERHFPRLTGRWLNQHAIVRDVDYPPGGRAQNEGFVGVGLEDHLLIEFAHTH